MIDEAVEALEGGRVVGMPTDTVYGLAAHPDRPEAVERLYELKGRPDGKPIALLVGSMEQAAGFVVLDGAAAALARRHWPGGLTLVARAVRPFPEWIGDRGLTVGVRMPDHDLALELLGRTGPLAVTSANLSGRPSTVGDVEARRIFGEAVACYLPGTCPGGTSSTVVDVTGPEPVVLRRGPIQID